MLIKLPKEKEYTDEVIMLLSKKLGTITQQEIDEVNKAVKDESKKDK